MVSFKYFRPLWSVSLRFLAGFVEDQNVFKKKCESIFYTCVHNGFYYASELRSVGRSAQTYRKCLILSIFNN